MKLRIKRARAGLFKSVPCIICELNKYDLEKAQNYNDRDLTGYTIEIVKQKRSNDQNRYMWELISQISDRSGVSQNDIYKEAIRNAGAYVDLKIDMDAYEAFKKMWHEKGVGWFVELMSEANGEIICRAYCGTSSYNSAEMSRLIEWVVAEAKWYDIDTETQKRKAEWNV